MPLMPVAASPTLRMISKAAEIDPVGTCELVRLSLYEVLCDQIDLHAPLLDQEFAKQEEVARRTLVKEYISKRQRGEDVSEVLQVAAEMTVSKDDTAVAAKPDDKKTKWWDARDKLGRFATALGAAGAANTGGKFGTLSATGAALSSLSDDEYSTRGTLGAMATAAAGLGSEADKVLGNAVRRTAYRYRGTEKLPNKGLKREVKNGLAIVDPSRAEEAARLAQAEQDAETRGRALAGKPFDKDRSSVRARTSQSPSVAVGTYYNKEKGLSSDQKEMRVAGDIASSYLIERLPDPEAVSISIAAGAVPPSQGVIIDADGDIVSEAVGFNGDHYVPFDLKNLRSLQGGQYVRTRATGGPTTEDIYTGLLAGARQVQVVSASGVFTLEFDPSLRGGRRYNDKARQMVGRYQRILDAIDQSKQSKLYQNDLSGSEKREIYARLADRYSGEDLETLATREIEREREKRSYQAMSEEEIEAEARRRLRSTDNRGELKNLIADVKEENRQNSVKRFQLDGDGYEAALNALKTEFPYFIRDVKRERLPDFVNSRGLQNKTSYSGAVDRGYASPKTAVAGLARSVTREDSEGRVRPTRAYERPTAPGAKKDTDKATQGGTEASEGGTGTAGGGAPKAEGFLAAARDDEAQQASRLYERVVGEAMAYLTLPDPSTGVPAVERDDLLAMSDNAFKNAAPHMALAAVHLRFAESGERDLLTYMANKAGPNERARYVKMLDQVESVIENKNLPVNDVDQVADAASSIKALVQAMDPFAKGEEPLSYDPSANDGRGLYLKEIDALGLDPAKYKEWRSNAIKNPEAAAYLETFEEAVEKDELESAATDIKELLREYREAKHDGDDVEIERAARSVATAQAAYSFAYAKKVAQSFFRATGKDWDEDAVGKGLAAPAAASRRSRSESRAVRKRHVSWHPLGTDLADRLQALLVESS